MSEQGPGQWRKARAARQPMLFCGACKYMMPRPILALRTAACLWHPSLLMGQGPYPGGRREALAALRLGRCGGGRGRLPAQAQQGEAQVRGGSKRRQSAPPRRGRESARRGGGCAASHQQPGATLHTEKEGGKPVRGRAGLTWEGRGGMVRSWSWSRSQWGSPPAIPRTRKSATCKEQARRRGATWPPVCLNIGQAGRVATCWGHRRTAPTRRGARQARSPWCPSVHRGPC
jgi:hypothetical protein